MPAFDIRNIPSQKGKIAIVTGANTGLGFETALALASREMKVIMACRDMEKARLAGQAILRKVPGANIEVMLVDLSSLSSVHDFAIGFISRYNRLDLLINNAGIMVPPYSLTKDGFESQFAVNYLSHFLLTGLLLDVITKTPGSRIVTLASNAHRKGFINFEDINSKKEYSPMKAYRQSKLACLVFAFELQRRLEKNGYSTISVAAHPGVVVTELVRHIPKWLMFIGKPVTALTTQSPQKGALPILYAALAPDVKGGEYFGPQGRSEWKGKPGRAYTTPLSKDEQVGKRLWEVTEKLTGRRWLSSLI
jgi:NAD(P)-dependent dehydrogenase (short-subunit alcohol dehydrogenase family)